MKLQVKEEWKTPELIALVRNNPEEAVLVDCKTIGVGSGPTGLDSGCRYIPSCLACFNIDPS